MEVIITSAALTARIKEHLTKMTRSERLIGDHLVKHALDAAFLPAARLGELIGVSESSIFRFSKSLGYASYQELQLELQHEVRERITMNTPARLQQAVTREPTGGNTLSAAIETDIHNLRITHQQIEPAVFDTIVTLLCEARRVVTVGMRGAAPLAQLFAYSLNLLRPGVSTLAHQSETLPDQLIDLDSQDVMVGFAYSRQALRTISAVELAKRTGARTIAVTDDPLSPIALRSDHSLLVATESEAFIQSYTAACAVVHMLVAAVGKALHSSAMERLKAIELNLDSSDVFFKERR